MKRILALILVLSMLCVPMLSCDGGSDVTDGSSSDSSVTPPALEGDVLYVGYGRECISPKDKNGKLISVPLAGYADTNSRLCATIKSDLYASCTAFRDTDGDMALLYTLDLHAMDVSLADSLAKRISEATAVPEENIILNVTHTHAAPVISGFDRNELIAPYRDILINGIVSAGEAAVADLTLCTELYAGNIEVDGYNFIRRYLTDDEGNLTAHEIEGDHSMPLVRFAREGKKDVILANWAAHCDTVSQNSWLAVSADYIGSFRDTVEQKLDAYVSIHMGAAGDVNPSSRLESDNNEFPGTNQYGRELAFIMIGKLETLEKLEIKSDIKSLTSKVRLEYDHSTDHLLDKANELNTLYSNGDTEAFNAKCKEYGIASIYEVMYIRARASNGKYGRLPVSAVSIGNVAFGVACYEMFAQNGMNIKEASEFDQTFVCAYSNGMIGYIPADYAFENGGYEVYSCQYVKGSGEILQDEIIRMIDELYSAE